jgi:hypothetical protein
MSPLLVQSEVEETYVGGTVKSCRDTVGATISISREQRKSLSRFNKQGVQLVRRMLPSVPSLAMSQQSKNAFWSDLEVIRY